MAANTDAKTVTLSCGDGTVFTVERYIVDMSQTITTLVEDLEDQPDAVIPLLNVSGPVMAKVIEFCRHHCAPPVADSSAAGPSTSRQTDIKREDSEATKKWNAEFLEIEQSALFDLILAANYLNIAELLDVTCDKVADMMKNKTPEEIRKTFNIKNDFTPEEEEEIRRENLWMFD
jgi:S-phase kinase-associated protein 1